MPTVDKITATGHVAHCLRYDIQLWQHQSNYIGVRLLPSLSYATLYLSTMSFTLYRPLVIVDIMRDSIASLYSCRPQHLATEVTMTMVALLVATTYNLHTLVNACHSSVDWQGPKAKAHGGSYHDVFLLELLGLHSWQAAQQAGCLP